MPRVTDAYRQARRDEIVAATLRAIARRGLRGLTIADVLEESGLSAGSLYSHFATKNELVELVATRVIDDRIEALQADSAQPPRAPRDIVHWWLIGLESRAVPFGTVLQIWGESIADPGIGAVVQRRMLVIEDAFAAAAERWLAATGGDTSQARATAQAMLTFCQGYVARSAVLGPQDLDASLAALDLLTVRATAAPGSR